MSEENARPQTRGREKFKQFFRDLFDMRGDMMSYPRCSSASMKTMSWGE